MSSLEEVSSRFDGLRSDKSYEPHYLSFMNGGKPAEEVLEAVHGVLKDVHDERFRTGIIDAAIAHDVGGTAILAIVDHAPTPSEARRLQLRNIKFQEWILEETQ